jgi:hypothetical protein
MASYMIGYDLNRPGKNYPELIDAIKSIGAWWHYLDSTWVVKTDAGSSAIRDKLVPHIDHNDELLVVKLTGEGAWSNALVGKPGDWLSQNL